MTRKAEAFWGRVRTINNFPERESAIAQERVRLEEEHAQRIQQAREAVAALETEKKAALADFDERKRDAENAAVTKRRKEAWQAFSRYVPAILDNPPNQTLFDFVTMWKAQNEENRRVLGPTSGGVSRAFLYVLADHARTRRPGIVNHYGDSFWLASNPSMPVSKLSKVEALVRAENLAYLREALQDLDACFYVGGTEVDEEALAAWQARINPDPRIFEAYQAEAKARAEEEYRKRSEAACLHAQAYQRAAMDRYRASTPKHLRGT